ncbi:unnamed protein product [Diatraea saccharalis]|uniref:Insulin-like domain-containing protein n=1 Tax=Diatraea saccharalis TaxID=40085 RepID=A0A9N9R957_9NEOP|nr:unnamed protein product [Diatraea saccharalis]
MVLIKTYQLAILAAALLWQTRTDARSSALKFCGRQLGEIMSKVCYAYNSPSWDVPTVVEHGALARRKRQLGIADECCTIGCTWEQLSKYCSVSAYSESPLGVLEAHLIADRSAEDGGNMPPAMIAQTSYKKSKELSETRREVGRERSRGYGSARRRRCWCRRKRRSGRRRTSIMGNMNLIKNAVRAAPVVGTVSPLLTWGRTLNTDLPPIEQDRYAYVAIYT